MVVIAALSIVLVVQSRRATQLEGEWVMQSQRASALEEELVEQNRRATNLEGELKERKEKDEKLRVNYTAVIRDLRGRLDKQPRSPIERDGAARDGK